VPPSAGAASSASSSRPLPAAQSSPPLTARRRPESPRRPWWQTLTPAGGPPDVASSSFLPSAVACPGSVGSARDAPPAAQVPPGMRRDVRGYSLPPLGPSEHVRWARRVREAQHTWFQESRRWRAPRSNIPKPPWQDQGTDTALTANPDATAAVEQPDDWAANLRRPEELDGRPADWQERKHKQRRQKHGLDRLRQRQARWRLKQLSMDLQLSGASYRSGEGGGGSLSEDVASSNQDTSSGEEQEWLHTKQHSDDGSMSNSRHSSMSSQSTHSSDGETPPRRKGKGSARPLSGHRASAEAAGAGSGAGGEAVGSSEEELVGGASCGSSQGVSRWGLTLSTSDGSSRVPSFPSSKRSSASTSGHRRGTPDPILDERVDQGQAPILEEEDGDADSPEERHTLEAWENWRAEFQWQLLDTMASWYEGNASTDSTGQQELQTRQLERWAERFLMIPRSAVQDVCAKAKWCSEDKASVRVPSLVDFLELCRAAKDFAEREHATTLWNTKDLQNLRDCCISHQNRSGMVPPDKLFNVFSHLGIDTKVIEGQQQHIADVARDTMQRRGEGRSAMGVNAYYEDEVIRIVTRCTRDWERQGLRRHLDDEREARVKAGFSHFEMEELRELFRLFKEMDLPDAPNDDLKHRLTIFLSQCGVRKLSRADLDAMRQVVAQPAAWTPPEAGQRNAEVTFGLFVRWMSEVFKQSIGGLSRSSIQTREEKHDAPYANLPSFARAFLREHMRHENQQEEVKPAKCTLGGVALALMGMRASGAAGAGASAAATAPAAGGGDDDEEDCTSAAGLVMEPSASAPSSMETRHAMSMGSKRRTSSSSRRRKAERSGGSGGGSSGKKSASSRGTSLGTDRDEEELEDEPRPTSNVPRETSLPPSEAMLSRREIRACSIDAGRDAALPLTQHAQTGGTGDVKGQGGSSGSASAGLASEPFAGERKAKHMADAEVVVRAAIMELEEQADERSDNLFPPPLA